MLYVPEKEKYRKKGQGNERIGFHIWSFGSMNKIQNANEQAKSKTGPEIPPQRKTPPATHSRRRHFVLDACRAEGRLTLQTHTPTLYSLGGDTGIRTPDLLHAMQAL